MLEYRRIRPGQGHEEGRRLLAQMYQEATGEGLPQIAVTALGKPYFPEGEWHFSISHTPAHVFCALAKKPVGIDGEELSRAVNPALAQRVLSPAEYARYRAAPDKNRAFLALWVLKEAAAKCSGRGMGYPHDHTDFSPDDPRVTEIDGCLVAVVEED